MTATRRSLRLSINKLTSPAAHLPPPPRNGGRHSARSSKIKSENEYPKPLITKEEEEESSDDCILIENETEIDRNWVKSKSKTNVANDREQDLSAPRKIKEINCSQLSRQRLQEQDNDRKRKTNDEKNKQTQQVSPSKQTRHQENQKNVPPQVVTSPSRLLEKLHINEIKQTPLSEGEEQRDEEEKKSEMLKSTGSVTKNDKYRNARRALNNLETENLPGREAQLQELREFLTKHLENHCSGSLYVSGQPGTGKTACLSLLLRSPEFVNRLKCVYVNCTSITSVGGIYRKLCTELKLQATGRSEKDALAAIQKYLRNSKRMVLIVLDEIDQLCTTKQNVLYTIFEWPAIPDVRLILIGIANSLDLTDRALVRLNARCEIKPQLMHFPSYTKQQIVDIFKSRLKEADVLDVFPPVTLQLLAAKVSAVSGDVRRALDIGRRVVEIAEKQKREGIQKEFDLKNFEQGLQKNENVSTTTATNIEQKQDVKVTQVAAVLNTVYGASQNLGDDIEDSFPLQQKLTLCTMMLILRNDRHKDINIGRLHEIYRRICMKRNIQSLDQTEFASLVELIETRGILRIVRKKESRLSKVVLQWDEEEVNAALKDKQLIASILDDISCLQSKS